MSLQNEDHNSQEDILENLHEAQTKPKIMYTREFLLSLSDLDICKKLPSDFDGSILSEFAEVLQSIQDRPRNPGSFSLQGFRRNELGSSPPTRGDSSNYSRGSYGRWESRSSGRSDRDSDSQSDRDSDSGRRYGHLSRRSWQTPEHDGLLGSGSFPRPSGYAAGIHAAKVRANENYQLRKKDELYQPPRPYKATPYSRRDTDLYNDETFGSMEHTSEDRAEEEKRRRDSFELMRKEQQKFLQEKQKMSLEKHNAENSSGLTEILEGSKEEKGLLGGNKELEVSTATPILRNESEKTSFSSHASRPPVPPGFNNSILEKSSGTKSSVPPTSTETGKPVAAERQLYFRTSPVQNGKFHGLEQQLSKEISSIDRQTEDKSDHELLPKEGQIVNSESSLGVPNEKVNVEDQHGATSPLDVRGILNNSEIIELNAKLSEDKIVDRSKGNYSSVLEKIFGSVVMMNEGGTVDSAEHHNDKVHDTWSPKEAQSSKFARWFSEEEPQPADNISSGRPNDLLSLFVGGDKVGSQVPAAKADNFTPECSYESSEITKKLTVEMPSAANGVSEEVLSIKKKEVASNVLTCEDLEQAILSEYGQKNSNTMPLSAGWSTSSVNIEQPMAHDDHSSQHLLSMLQKGSDANTMTLGVSAEIGFGEKVPVSEARDIEPAVHVSKTEELTQNVHNPGKTLTLETLFGTAFMKELQSAEAPVSVQRGPNESTRNDALEPRGDIDFPSTIDEIGLQRTSHGNSILSLNNREQTTLAKAGNWLGFDGSEMNSSKHPIVMSKHGGYDGKIEFQLPEEESLISVGDPLNPSTLLPTGNSSKKFFSSKAHVNVAENLAAVGAGLRDTRTTGPHGSYEHMDPEIPFRNIQIQPSPPQNPGHATHGMPLFNLFDSHPNHSSSHSKFMGTDSVFNHDASANSKFPADIIRPPFHHPASGYDPHAHHSMLHPMQISGNRPQLLPGFPRGAPVPYSGNQSTGFIQDMNPVQGFPFGPNQPNVGSIAPDNSFGNPPEAFQRLIEMELRANSKQIHPLRATQNRGVYGHELDMRFPR